MPKRIALHQKVELGGIDVSDYVTRWQVTSVAGELMKAEIDIADTDAVIEIIDPSAQGQRHVTTDARVLIIGADNVQVDISKWVEEVGWIRHVGKLDIVRLVMHADREVLRINGTYPWDSEAYHRCAGKEVPDEGCQWPWVHAGMVSNARTDA